MDTRRASSSLPRRVRHHLRPPLEPDRLVAPPTSLWLDGAFACPLGGGRARFDPHGEVTDHDVERLARAIRSRVLRALRSRG